MEVDDWRNRGHRVLAFPGSKSGDLGHAQAQARLVNPGFHPTFADWQKHESPQMGTRKRLSRRPVHGAAAEQMEVKVIHGLAAVFAVVDHHAIAFAEMLLAGDLHR